MALACLALLVTACESGDSGSSDADVEAGRATVDAMSREHANDTPEPSEAYLPEARRSYARAEEAARRLGVEGIREAAAEALARLEARSSTGAEE